MGAVLRKSFCFVFLFFVISLFGLSGCGDIYKNMKIVVDAEKSVTLYLRPTQAQGLEAQEDENEPYFKEFSITIEGVKDKNISKNLEVVFSNPQIASAGDFEYDGNNAKIKIYAAFPGTTTMFIKSLDNSAISSEGIEINVIEPMSQIVVDDVLCAVSKGSSIDLRKIDGIKFLPITSNDDGLEFCFEGGQDVNPKCGRIEDKHILTVFSDETVSLGPVKIVAKSSRDDVESKTFEVVIYNEFNSSNIKVKNGTEELTTYESIEETKEEAKDLVIISNFVEGSSESVERVLDLSVDVENDYEYEILNEDNLGIVSVHKTVDEGGARNGEFSITPQKEGITYLKVRAYLVYNGVRYLAKDAYIKVEIKTIVKKAFIKAQNFTEISKSDEVFEFSINDETEKTLNLELFESSKYAGTAFDVFEINPTRVVNNKFRLVLGSGVDADKNPISLDNFKKYIRVYAGDLKASFSTFDEETNSYLGTEFDVYKPIEEQKSNKNVYISYDDALLNDDLAKKLSSFGMKILFNYEEGLPPFEINVNCNIFQSVLNLKLSEESEKDLILKRNKICTLTLTAETNVNLSLFQITSNNENSVKITNVFQLEDKPNSISVEFQTIEVGTATISFIEKSTLKVVSININVVNINAENLTYLEIEAQNEISRIDYNYSEANVFDNNLTYYKIINDDTYSQAEKTEVTEGNYTNFYFRNTDGFNVYIQAGAEFSTVLKTSKDATISLEYEVVDNETTSYKNLVNKDIKYDLNQKTFTFKTLSNEVRDINDENTFEQIVIKVKYYACNEDEKIEEKEKIITIKVATYLELENFGANLNNKNFEIFDNKYLSAYNQESGIGTQSFVPTITKRTQSGLKYELEYELYFNGNKTSLEEALEKGWIVEEIKDEETFALVGLKIKPQTSDEIEGVNILTVYFSVNEFNKVYPISFNVECIKPTLLKSFELNCTEINIEDFENSNYSSAEIKITEFSPYNVFDKNLTFLVYSYSASRSEEKNKCIAVYDEVLNEIEERFNQNSPLTLEKNNGVVTAKYSGENILDESYYIKVLPSYLVNEEESEKEEYYTNIINNTELSPAKVITVNFVNGTEDNPYQIKNQDDLEKMFLSEKTNSYFVLMDDITLSEWSVKKNLKYNLMSNPYSKVLNATEENYNNYYTKTLNYVHGAEYDEDEKYYSYDSTTGAYTVCAEGVVTKDNFSDYFVLEYYKKVENADSFNEDISYYSKNGKYSISGLNTNFINEIVAGVRIENINFYYDSFEKTLTTNFGLIAQKNSGIIKNVALNPRYTSSLIELNTDTDNETNIGGFVGENIGKIKNCYGSINLKLNLGEAVSSINIGGFVGKNSGKISTEASLITLYKSNITVECSDIKEKTNIGGLVGQNSGNISGALKTSGSNIIGTSIEVQTNINSTNCNNVGGICGENSGSVQNVSIAPKITANNYVGGAIGKNSGDLTYVLCEFYNNGLSEKTSIYANDYVGGLVGELAGQIENCYAISYYQNYNLVSYGESLQGGNKFYGDIVAQNYVGGLVGYADNAKISKSFANVSVGLKKKFESATNYDENETYYSYSSETGYEVASGVTAENVTDYYVAINIAGGFVGYLSDNTNNFISNSYAIVNMTNISNNIGQFIGQFDYSGASSGFVIYCYSVFNGGDVSGVPFANMIGNKNYCSNCYYQDNKVEESTSSSEFINARNSAEMQAMSTYSGWNSLSTNWTIIEGVNNKYPIIKIGNLNFYNTSIGQIVIDEFLSDENSEENPDPLPKFRKYDEGKIVVFLDSLIDSNFSLKLSDLISLEDINNYAELELKTDNTNISFEIGDKNSLDRFVLKFNGTGLFKITISSRKSAAISSTFQIFVVGGFKSFSLPETIYIQKGGENTAYVTFETNSSQSYDDSLGLKLTAVFENSEDSENSDGLIDVNQISWNEEKELYYDLNNSNGIIFYGNLEEGQKTKITTLPFVKISFYNESNQKVDSVLLLDETIKANIGTKTITAIVYEGVKNLYLNEIETETENRFKLKIVLSAESDNIEAFDPTDLEIYQHRIKEDVTSENYVGLYVRNSDGSYQKVLESDAFDETKTYYEYIQWKVTAENCLKHNGETISFGSTTNGNIFEMTFYVEHKPHQRMTEKEVEDWFVFVENKDGTQKEDSLSINWIPSEAHSIEITHFLSLQNYLNNYNEFGYEDGTDRIASGAFGMLKINVTESFSDFDYIKVEGYANSQTISFDRYIINNERKLVFDYNNSDYSQHIGSSLILFNDKNANGVFYVSTLTSVGLPLNTEFLVTISVYKNGVSEAVLTKTEKLYTIFAPWVKMNVVENYARLNDDARLNDGVIIAKGTKLNINITGVLQDSYVSVSVDGGEGVYINTQNTIVGNNEMITAPQTNSNYFETISIYAGVDANITSEDGYITLTATVNSNSVITYFTLKLYLVDYLIEAVVIENVDYNYYILDGEEYIKATKYEANQTYYTRSGTENNFSYIPISGVSAESFKPTYAINIQDGYKPLRLGLTTQFGEFYANSESSQFIEKAKELASSFGVLGQDFDALAYERIVDKIIEKIKELNAYGNQQNYGSIWIYKNEESINLNAGGSYSYFFLRFDETENAFLIRGRTEVEILLNVSLNRGYKLSGDGTCYELLLQKDVMDEDFLQISNGIYDSNFAIQFINDKEDEQPTPVGTVDELRNMQANEHYILTENLTLTDWTPLTTNIGSLDGNGYKLIIESFNVSGNGNIGLFETISTYNSKSNTTESTRLINIVVEINEHMTIDLEEQTNVNFGFLAGQNNGGIIYNCEVISNKETTESADYSEYNKDVQTILESTPNTTKIFIKSRATSVGGINIGGLVGTNSGFITNSRFGRLEDVKIRNEVVDNLKSTCGFTIVGVGKMGGLTANNLGVISASYFYGSDLINTSIASSADDSTILTGGLVGQNSGRINTSFVESEKQDAVVGTNDVLNGVEYIDGKFVRRNKNKIYSGASVGGFVNINNGTIENCYANISLDSVFAGGFVYRNSADAIIKYSYSTCAIKDEKSNNGAFVGIDEQRNINNDGTIKSCYYLIDKAVSKSIVDPAIGLERIVLCAQKEKILGFVFGDEIDDNRGIWFLDLGTNKDYFEAPTLIEAHNIAYSHREVLFDEEERALVYNNANFGDKENPRIVYNPTSFSKISITSSSEEKSSSYTRIVADVDFNQNMSLINGVDSTKLKFMGNMQGNGMTFKNIKIIVEGTEQEEEAGSTQYLGFFAELDSAIISNLTLDIAAFNATTTDVVGGLCGYLNNSYINTITVLSSSSAQIVGAHIVGGIVGYAEGEHSNMSNLTSSISVEASYDVPINDSISLWGGKEENEDNAVGQSSYNQILNIEKQSYAGGIAGVANLGDKVKTYEQPKIINCEVLGNFLIKAEIVGGLFGCIDEKTAISYCKFILNENGLGQELQSTLFAGGLVGDNRGLIIYSYIGLDDVAQTASDKAFSVNRNVNAQAGTKTLFTGRSKAIGGLVGFNVGSYSKTDDLSGGIEYSYSRVNVQNSSSEIAGGVIGIATYKTDDWSSDLLSNVSYEVNAQTLTNLNNELYQSAFLYGVYTTGQVMANKYAGGLVGVSNAVINVLKSSTSEAGNIAVFPGSVSITDSSGLVGYVIGKANYTSQNIHFVEIGGRAATKPVSTISSSSSTPLVGGVENSVFGEQFKNIEYDSLAGFVHSVEAMEKAFKAFGTEDDNNIIWDYDKTQENFIFPRLYVGNVKEANVIKTVKDYLTYVKSGKRGNYSVQCDYDGNGKIIPIVFDFTSEIKIEIDNTKKELYNWFKDLYENAGPSGVMEGYTSNGDNALIEIIIDKNTLIPFFGKNVNSFKLSNIDFVIKTTSENSTVSKIAGDEELDAYFGMLMSQAKNCTFKKVGVSFDENIQFELNEFTAVGGFVGYSEKSIYEDITVSGFDVKNESYTIKDNKLFVGGMIGQSKSDYIRTATTNNNKINIKANENENSTIAIGGVVGYADGDSFRISGAETICNILFESNAKEVYVGGVIGYVKCSQKSTISYITAKPNISINSGCESGCEIETAFVGGAVGYSFLTTISDVSVVGENKGIVGENKIVVKNAQTAYVGGIVGSYNTTIINTRTDTIILKSDLNSNKSDINITATAENIVSNSYVGGIAGIVNLIIDERVSISSIEKFVIKDNETEGGEIVVTSNQEAYVGGLFGGILLNGTETQGKNNLILSNSQNAANIAVYNTKKAYIGGICGYSDINISFAINYGRLLNDYEETGTADCLSYIGGIVAKTSQSIEYCLSFGAIFEPGFVEYLDTQSETTKQNSIAQALVADAPENSIKNSRYSSDFTGVLQDDYSSNNNILASKLIATTFSGFEQVNSDANSLTLPRIAGFSEKSIEFKTLSDIFSQNQGTFTTYILKEDASVSTTLKLSEKSNLQIIGMGHTITTNGCALFDSVPKTVMISGIQVLSSKDILAESNFGLLAIENNGVITNCVAGQLPQYREFISNGGCSELYERYISGYNGTRVNVKYDDCNPFGMVAGDFGQIASLSKHTTKSASNSTITAFNSLSELFATFMNNFEIPTNGSEYTPTISSDARNAYTQFYNKAIELYNGSLVSFTKNVSNDPTRSVVIGINYPYTMTFGTDVSLESINFQTIIANLFGFSSEEEFMNYAQDLANIYSQYRTSITNSTTANEALENGCFYTSNGSFVFPIAVKNELPSIVLAYVILDTSGFVSVWVNDITAALWATNFNASYYTDSIINNELYCKNILFITGPSNAAQSLGKDLPNRQFGESESGILTIYVNNSDISVGALVGINNKTINNCWSYADIKLDNYKKISKFDSNLTYYERIYVPGYYQYTAVTATNQNYMNYYIFGYVQPTNFDSSLTYYEKTYVDESYQYTKVESSSVTSENYTNYYIFVDSYVQPTVFNNSLTYYERIYVPGYYQYTEVESSDVTDENFENFYVLNTVQNSSVGGLVGKNEFKLSYAYAMGKLDVFISENNSDIKIGGVVGENTQASTNYVKYLISYVDVYSSGLSVGRVVCNNSNNQMLHISDLSRTTDKFVKENIENNKTIVKKTTDVFDNEQIFGSDFFKRDNSYNYGYYYLALNNQKSLTANNNIYYIENFVELNMLNKINNNVNYAFVRDLNAKTPLSLNGLQNSSFTINGNGYFVFSDVLINEGNTYSLFNFNLTKNSKLENILYKFGNTQINSSANSLIVAPLIKEVVGGQISNCAVYGNIDIQNPSGTFGGLVGKLTSGEVKFSFSVVNITISNANDFVVGGLVGEMETANLDHCFTAGNIHLKSASGLVYIGGLVGKLIKGDATIQYCYFAGKNNLGTTKIRTDVNNNVYLGEFVGLFERTPNSDMKEFLKYCLFEGYFIEDEGTNCDFVVGENDYINKLKFGDDEISSLIAIGCVKGIEVNNINLQNNYATLKNTYGIDSSNYFITRIVDKTTLTTNSFASYNIEDENGKTGVSGDENKNNLWKQYSFSVDGGSDKFPYLNGFFDLNNW
ncbi:MAG: hypothetical protein IJ837_01780 [Clostridia bacterium]|nr:hypothetical protein [Clostridia bacterium]